MRKSDVMQLMMAAMLMQEMGIGFNGEPTSAKRKISKPIPKGCKEFDIDGIKVIAINRKNAVRKANKIRAKKL